MNEDSESESENQPKKIVPEASESVSDKFELEVDKYLRSIRETTQSQKLERSSNAVRLLPPSSQTEYANLLKKLISLEEKKRMIKEKTSKRLTAAANKSELSSSTKDMQNSVQNACSNALINDSPASNGLLRSNSTVDNPVNTQSSPTAPINQSKSKKNAQPKIIPVLVNRVVAKVPSTNQNSPSSLKITVPAKSNQNHAPKNGQTNLKRIVLLPQDAGTKPTVQNEMEIEQSRPSKESQKEQNAIQNENLPAGSEETSEKTATQSSSGEKVDEAVCELKKPSDPVQIDVANDQKNSSHLDRKEEQNSFHDKDILRDPTNQEALISERENFSKDKIADETKNGNSTASGRAPVEKEVSASTEHTSDLVQISESSKTSLPETLNQSSPATPQKSTPAASKIINSRSAIQSNSNSRTSSPTPVPKTKLQVTQKTNPITTKISTTISLKPNVINLNPLRSASSPAIPLKLNQIAAAKSSNLVKVNSPTVKVNSPIPAKQNLVKVNSVSQSKVLLNSASLFKSNSNFPNNRTNLVLNNKNVTSTAVQSSKPNPLLQSKLNSSLATKQTPQTASLKRKQVSPKTAVPNKIRKTNNTNDTKIQLYLNKISALVPDAQKRLIEKSEGNYKNQR